MSTNSIPSCPYCAGKEVRFLGKLPDSNCFAGKFLAKPLKGGSLFSCGHCQLKFRFPVHDMTTYVRLYDNAEVSTWSSNALRPDWDLISSYIRTHLPQGGRVLDFGCYTGGLLSRLGSDYERHGVEINKAAAAFVATQQFAQVWPSLDGIPSELRFDVIIASDVVEHITNPGDLIERLVAQLADDGILLMTTGDAENYLWRRFRANWWYCFFPEHISFLSEVWLSHFSHSHGLSIKFCDKFFYSRLPSGYRYFATALTYIYGYFPATYIRLGNIYMKIRGRPRLTSVAGNGVSADHLFIVLARNGSAHER